jgi:hypothetical protein
MPPCAPSMLVSTAPRVRSGFTAAPCVARNEVAIHSTPSCFKNRRRSSERPVAIPILMSDFFVAELNKTGRSVRRSLCRSSRRAGVAPAHGCGFPPLIVAAELYEGKRMNRALPPGDRGSRKRTCRREPRRQWVMCCTGGLVGRATHPPATSPSSEASTAPTRNPTSQRPPCNRRNTCTWAGSPECPASLAVPC